MTTIHHIYRLSDNGYNKPKFPHATKMHCLNNFITRFDIDDVHLFVDQTNLQESTRVSIENIEDTQFFGNLQYYVGGSSAGSWRHVFDYVLNQGFDDTDIVYFVEDDYLHLPGSKQALLEGLEISDYVTLYLHGDRFIPANLGGNPFVDESGSFMTRMCKSQSSFWVQVESTTMTFATSIKQLKEDRDVWEQFTLGSHPNDFGCFMELQKRGRSLIAPVPSLSTHCEPAWAAPGIDWSVV